MWEQIVRFSVRVSLMMMPWEEKTKMLRWYLGDAQRYLWYPPNSALYLTCSGVLCIVAGPVETQSWMWIPCGLWCWKQTESSSKHVLLCARSCLFRPRSWNCWWSAPLSAQSAFLLEDDPQRPRLVWRPTAVSLGSWTWKASRDHWWEMRKWYLEIRNEITCD